MGDVVHGSQYKQTGASSNMTVNNSAGVSRADVDAAVVELRAFIDRLTRTGAVGPNGQVNDPAAVVAEVESNKSRLAALGKAVLGGAKDAVLTVVQGGVAALVVALLGRG
ncbi:hypothetical protein [Umezawaea sp. NPDC059074]|uniref:hypothetical protein n=1 Tax=Umezawaea sp. NPDC059074 TaxID=3346716 RepID=UPI0036AD1E6D